MNLKLIWIRYSLEWIVLNENIAREVIKDLVKGDVNKHIVLLQDKEMLEDYLITTLNNALDRAEKISETELAAVAKEGMPSIPGMDMFR